MDTKEKLLKAFEQFRPHINGHKTAIDLFFEGIKEVEDLQEQVKNCSIPDVSIALSGFMDWLWLNHNILTNADNNKIALEKYLATL